MGDIVNYDEKKDKTLDLLNEQLNLEAAFHLTSVAKEAVNQKEVLDALAAHKDEERFRPAEVDKGESEAIGILQNALQQWIKKQSVAEEVQEDGTVKGANGQSRLRSFE